VTIYACIGLGKTLKKTSAGAKCLESANCGYADADRGDYEWSITISVPLPLLCEAVKYRILQYAKSKGKFKVVPVLSF
jgi:hypothetical protein